VIAVVALLLIVAPFAVAAGLHALHERGARVETAERAARAAARRADPPTVVIPAQLLDAVAADWDLIARQQRRDGLPVLAHLSDQRATDARLDPRRTP
jgi:hypothetical protein